MQRIQITTYGWTLPSVQPEMRYFVQGQGMRPAKGGINRSNI